jgi:hypothetical protein
MLTIRVGPQKELFSSLVASRTDAMMKCRTHSHARQALSIAVSFSTSTGSMLPPRPLTLGQLAVLAVLLFTVRAYEAPDSKKLHESRKLIREVSSSTYTAAAEADRVTSLPGWGDLDTGLFAGY